MHIDFWNQRIPPDSKTFQDELERRVSEIINKGFTNEQIDEFAALISSEKPYEEVIYFVDEDLGHNCNISIEESVLLEKYPAGNWHDDPGCKSLVQKQGFEPDSFELKKELATIFWLEKNCPNYAHIVAEVKDTLHKEFGHGRIYFHPDLSRMFRDAVLSGNATEIRAMFKKQKPCLLTVALGDRLLSRDACFRLVKAIEKLATPPDGKRRPSKNSFETLFEVFNAEKDRLGKLIFPPNDIENCKDHPGDKRFAEAITELLDDDALVKYTQSILEADAKELMFSIEEGLSIFALCIRNSLSLVKLAYAPVPEREDEDDYSDKVSMAIVDLHNAADEIYGLDLTSGKEGWKHYGV